MSPTGPAAPASVELFLVSTWLLASPLPKSSPSTEVTCPSPQKAVPQSCPAGAAGIAGSCTTASRTCKNSSSAGAMMCSASYARKNMYMFHMHKKEALKTGRMQSSINYGLNNIFHHHQINQILFFPYVHRFNGSNSALGGRKTPSSC